jgi:hypothetical protein
MLTRGDGAVLDVGHLVKGLADDFHTCGCTVTNTCAQISRPGSTRTRYRDRAKASTAWLPGETTAIAAFCSSDDLDPASANCSDPLRTTLPSVAISLHPYDVTMTRQTPWYRGTADALLTAPFEFSAAPVAYDDMRAPRLHETCRAEEPYPSRLVAQRHRSRGQENCRGGMHAGCCERTIQRRLRDYHRRQSARDRLDRRVRARRSFGERHQAEGQRAVLSPDSSAESCREFAPKER